MRLRKKPGVKSKLEIERAVFTTKPQQKRWRDVFQNENPLHVELGVGKGQFINTLAYNNPAINYVGIERVPEVLFKAVEKNKENNLNNLRFLFIDAEELSSNFAPNEIERLYLNFSDPWPKNRHYRRRLTYRSFLSIYKALLINLGEIHLKTDNYDFFEFSLREFVEAGLSLRNITYDLHSSNFIGNIMTEYEMRFVELGMPIYRCEAIKNWKEGE